MALLSSILGSTFKGDAASYPIYTVSQQHLAYAVYPTTVFNSSGTTLVNTGTGTFNWTCPVGVTKVKATVIAGGGGNNNDTCAHGAGFGGFAIGLYTVIPGTVYTITVGAGGAGIAPTGGSGGSSSFSSFCSATGGAGAPSGGALGASGTGTGGNLKNGNMNGIASDTVSYNNGIPFFGVGQPTIGVTSAQVSWTPGLVAFAGACGQRITTTLFGGVSGVVSLEWIG